MQFDDYQQIVRRRYEYAISIDTRDWDLHRSIFTDRIEMDFSSYSGAPGSSMAADDWVEGLKPLFTGLDATQHVMTNPIVDVHADQAELKMYMKAEHFLNNDAGSFDFALGGSANRAQRPLCAGAFIFCRNRQRHKSTRCL